MRIIAIIAVVLIAGLAADPAVADAPETSLRPVARPGHISTEVAREQPVRRGLFKSLRPLLRPSAVRRQARQTKAVPATGAVCGDPAIQGVEIGRVPGKIAGCGVENAVRIRAISGVALSQQAVMDCTTAKTLKSVIERGIRPAIGRKGGGVIGLRVVAHYACRTRNSRKGARISEHGKGHAIDIAAFQLRDGSEISVLKYWGRGSNGRVLSKIHRAACGPFGTVLGPNSDSYHRDHFHFDTARYRSGPYCR